MTAAHTRGSVSGMAEPLGTDDEGYLDFVEGLRSFNLHTVRAVMTASAGPALDASSDASLDEVVTAAERLPIVQFRDRLERSAQEMMHRGALEGYRRRQQELLDDLDEAERSDTGSFTVDDPAVPAYVRQADIHIQPGSFDSEPLAGYVYHRITDIFYLGRNDRSEMHQQIVDAVAGKVTAPHRALDLGCSVGQSATALKTAFPDAELHAVDVAGPMVRYARKRAVDTGLDIHFHQASAADMPMFESGSFDLVYAFIVFHELPVEVTRKVVSEVRRILRPGGVFVVVDFATGSRESDPSPLVRYLGWFDSTHNGEPFAPGFVNSDFESMLEQSFAEVQPDADIGLPLGALQVRIATA